MLTWTCSWSLANHAWTKSPQTCMAAVWQNIRTHVWTFPQLVVLSQCLHWPRSNSTSCALYKDGVSGSALVTITLVVLSTRCSSLKYHLLKYVNIVINITSHGCRLIYSYWWNIGGITFFCNLCILLLLDTWVSLQSETCTECKTTRFMLQ